MPKYKCRLDKKQTEWTNWKTWNKVRFSCCCSSLTFFSHKFTQRHMFPRNILPWNVPFQWKTASVTIFFQPALTVASKGPWGSSGESSVHLLGSTACPQKMVLQIKNRQHGTQHLSWKKWGGGWFFFFSVSSAQCQDILRTCVSTAL